MLNNLPCAVLYACRSPRSWHSLLWLGGASGLARREPAERSPRLAAEPSSEEPRLKKAAQDAIEQYGLGTGYRTLAGTHALGAARRGGRDDAICIHPADCTYVGSSTAP